MQNYCESAFFSMRTMASEMKEKECFCQQQQKIKIAINLMQGMIFIYNLDVCQTSYYQVSLFFQGYQIYKMGCQSSVSVSPSSTQPISFYEGLSICKDVTSMLSSVAHTSEQTTSLATSIIDSLPSIEQRESPEEKGAVLQLFTAETVQKIQKGELLYSGIEKLVLNKLGREKLKSFTKSRIYHMIANARKDKAIKEERKNQAGIDCLKTNQYDKLSDQQIDEICRYESVAEAAMALGGKVGMKFLSINQESKNITDMLLQCFTKYSTFVSNLKYNLQEREVMEIAKISKEACAYYQNGAFFLFVYLVKAVEKLEKQGQTSTQIEKKVDSAISTISNAYPPGQGLSETQKYLQQALIHLQDQKRYNKVIFSHKETPLRPQPGQSKQNLLEDIIMGYAKIAQSNRSLFQMLIKETCLKRPQVLPQQAHKKALTRIKEKMLFGKNETKSGEMRGSIREVLQQEQKDYLKKVDELLDKKESVLFKISDMVRGKCVFIDVEDIIQTVNDIKALVSRDNRFGLAQIQSRFTNKIPISDVTLKIVLNKQIVAELQLTVQTNAATYNFAHKVYELARTKVFSKVKITHNYFQQFKEDVRELTVTALRILQKQSKLSVNNQLLVNKYFGLEGVEPISLNEALDKGFQSKKDVYVSQLKNTLDQHLQFMILPLFRGQVGDWDKQLGKRIQNTLDMNLSYKLKATLAAFFFKKFDFSKEASRMQQFWLTQKQVGQKKRYIEEYLRTNFDLQTIFQYLTQSHRVFHRGQQLLQLDFYKKYESSPIYVKQIKFIESLVEQKNKETLALLKDFITFYFVVRDHFDNIYKPFQSFYKWGLSLIKDNPQLDKSKVLLSEINILNVQKSLIDKQDSNIQEEIKAAITIFKEREDQHKVLECQLLLFECLIKKFNFKSLDDIDKYYNKQIEEQARTLGLELKGRVVAEALDRIAQRLWMQYDKQSKRILNLYWKKALTELSRSRDLRFIKAMITMWDEFQKNGVQYPVIKTNYDVNFVQFSLEKIKSKGCSFLAKAKWPNLLSLVIGSNEIQSLGCEYISKADWKNLNSLLIDDNKIGSKGCEHLSKADWKHLTILNIRNNNIQDAGCEWLSKADWKNLTSLNLTNNQFGAVGCQHLSRADWKNLTELNLDLNKIGPQGCNHLSKADWKHLSSITLKFSQIQAAGVEFLSKADWKQLTLLEINACNMGQLAVNTFTEQIGSIQLHQASYNNADNIACEWLSKAKWKNLTYLNIDSNRFDSDGCQHLCKADWKKLTYLKIMINGIHHEEDIQKIKKAMPLAKIQ